MTTSINDLPNPTLGTYQSIPDFLIPKYDPQSDENISYAEIIQQDSVIFPLSYLAFFTLAELISRLPMYSATPEAEKRALVVSIELLGALWVLFGAAIIPEE